METGRNAHGFNAAVKQGDVQGCHQTYDSHREGIPVKKNDYSLPFMLLISLMTVVIGIAGCAAAEKVSQTKAEAAQTEAGE